MFRSLASIFAVLVAMVAGLALSAIAVAAPASSPRVAVSDASPAEDDPIDVDLGDLCALLAEADAGDEPDAPDAASRSAGVPDEPTDDPDDDDPVGGEDPANTANAIDCPGDLTDEGEDQGQRQRQGQGEAAETGAGSSKRLTLSSVLKKGSVVTGPVAISGPGTITQELWLDTTGGAVPRSAASAAAKKRTAKKPRGRILGGTLTRTVKQAGVVTMTVRLNSAGRTVLRGSKKPVRMTVKTITKVRGGKARTRSTAMILAVKSAK